MPKRAATTIIPYTVRRPIKASSLILPVGEADRAYLAGLFDGEGCMMWHKSTKSWRISITSSDEEIIKYLVLLGGVAQPKKRYSEKHSPAWNWYLYREADISLFIEAVIPYLRIKFKKCAIAYHEIRNKRIQRREFLNA